MIAFGEQVQVHLTQQFTEAVGVFCNLFTTGPAYAQQVRLCPLEMTDKKPGPVSGLKRAQLFAGILAQHLHAQRVGQIGADELATGTIAMGAENGKRILMFGAHQRVDLPRPWQ
ncbi:hypothetical protein D3C73_1352260 [compost metagenome]